MIEFGCLILFVQPDSEENNISFLISKFFLLWHKFYLKVYLLWLLYQGKRRKYMSGLFEKNQLYLWFLSSSLFLALFLASLQFNFLFSFFCMWSMCSMSVLPSRFLDILYKVCSLTFFVYTALHTPKPFTRLYRTHRLPPSKDEASKRKKGRNLFETIV